MSASPIDGWLAAPGRHPLVGTILHGRQLLTTAADGCRPSPLARMNSALAAHLADGGVLLLGEVHDNGAHHALRGHLIDKVATDLASRGRPAPALVFEHIRIDQPGVPVPPVPAMADRDQARQTARDLLARLDWANSGWPSATLFAPIFEPAIVHGLAIVPGHPSRAEVRDVARKGFAALPEATVKRLGLEASLPEPLANGLLDELEASHCGLMPRTAFANMALAQRYRDAHLASSLASAAADHGSAILLAGNGHVRSDRGVPWDLARMAAPKALVVAFLEVEDSKPEAESYVPLGPGGEPAADYVVLTPRAERPDPCEAMRAHFKKK